MTVYNKLQIIAIVLISALLAIFPGASFVGVLLELVAVYFISYLLLQRLSKGAKGARYALLAIWTLMSIGMVLNINWFTIANDGTVVDPVLLNDDANCAWVQLQSLLSGTDSNIVLSRRGYGTFLYIINLGGTPTIDSLLCVNMLAILIAIILTAAVCAEILGGYKKSKVFSTAMILLGSVSCFIGSGVLLIKDAICCLMIVASFYAVFAEKNGTTSLVVMMVSTLLCLLIRPQMLLFMVMIPMVGIFLNNKNRGIYTMLIVLMIAAYIYIVNQEYSALPFDANNGTSRFDINIGPQGRLAAYSAVSANYEQISIFGRIIRLPFSFAVQWLTPLPWAFGRDMVFGPSQAWMHVSFMWYAVGGMGLYCLIFKLKNMPRKASWSLIISFTAMLAIAFVTGGTVSRYCLPWIPAMIPAATWLVVSNNYKTKSFKVWAIAYGTLMLIAAAVAITVLSISNGGQTWEAI